MKRTKNIEWHEDCLRNLKYTIKELISKRDSLNILIEKQTKELEFYDEQIQTAINKGKRSFNKQRFLVRKK